MKKIFKYIVLFVLILLFSLIINPLNLDEIWSYGFTNNIYNGLIPYKDFNMVITPFYPFIMSLIFYIFGNNMLVFYIENTLIIILFIYICSKLLNDKTYLILPLLIFPISIVFPNYNFFLLFLFILLIYLEKNNKNDYLIGFILSFIFLTKQTVGISLLLVSLYYLKDKKLFKRFIGFIIPNIIFIIYLFITNSYREFIDLCFLGLFDFGKSNTNVFNMFFFMIIVLLIILVKMIKKDSKKIEYYYLLMFISICIPLFDLYHFSIYLVSFIIICLSNSRRIFNYKLIGLSLFIGLLLVYIFHSNFNYKVYPNNLNLFEYRYISSKNIKFSKNVLKFINKYNNKVMFIGPDAYYFKLINNSRIDYLDLINSGNWGTNGSSKLIKKVKSLDNDYVFFVRKSELGYGKQTDQNVIKYIIKNGKKIGEVEIYDVYKLGDIDG